MQNELQLLAEMQLGFAAELTQMQVQSAATQWQMISGGRKSDGSGVGKPAGCPVDVGG